MPSETAFITICKFVQRLKEDCNETVTICHELRINENTNHITYERGNEYLIRCFDIFAGIGGFRSGLEKVGGFEFVGSCEIDKYARCAYMALYDTGEEVYFEDARKIDPETLPDFDCICGGFPCQSFSIAGKRRGFDDARGTLFFEIARIAAVKKPKYLLLENVPGLLSHDNGWTFEAILDAL